MRIAVISDTHNRLPQEVRLVLAGADEIWHLGDVCDESIVQTLQQLDRPLKIVRGNCDSCTDWPLTLDLNLAGTRARLVHIPPRQAPAEIDLLFHGHTHVPRDEMVGSTRFLNPGCVNKANKGAPPSFAWLTVKKGEPVHWQVQRLSARS